jgi:hypothetical protein
MEKGYHLQVGVAATQPTGAGAALVEAAGQSQAHTHTHPIVEYTEERYKAQPAPHA